MRVVYIYDNTNLVSVNLRIPVGILHDGDKIGITHLIEHLLFYGHKKLSYQEVIMFFENNGGVLNASIDNYFTTVYFRIPKHFVSKGLMIVLDCIENFYINESDFLKEMKIVHNELSSISFGRLMIHETLERILEGISKREILFFEFNELMRFYRENYYINDLSIVFFGNYNEEFNYIVDGYNSQIEQLHLSRKKIIQDKVIKINSRINYTSMISFIGDIEPELELRAWKAYLTSGYSSILNREIINKYNYTYYIQFFKNIMIGNNAMIISFVQDREVDYLALDELLFNSLCTLDFSHKELKLIRSKVMLEFELLFENKGRFAKLILDNLDRLFETNVFYMKSGNYYSTSNSIQNYLYKLLSEKYIGKIFMESKPINNTYIIHAIKY
jgi:predicted Zn-dependent peptidase